MLTPVIFSGLAPPLVMVISRGTEIPTGTQLSNCAWSPTSANWSDEVLAYSPGRVPTPASGTSADGKSAEGVANDRLPVTPPGPAGVNLTGAVSLSPLCRVTGKITGVALPPFTVSVTWLGLTANWAAPAAALEVVVTTLTPVTVTFDEAVTVAFLVLAEPTPVLPNATDAPGGLTAAGRMPNPYRYPSSVATYTDWLLVAGVEKLAAVPMDAEKTGFSTHAVVQPVGQPAVAAGVAA